MVNGERISDERSRKWEQALAPYGKDIEEFAREKGLRVAKWHQDLPHWYIERPQKPEDLNKVWWNIQLIYDENVQEVSLVVGAWMDTKYDVPDGQVSERRLSDSPGRSLVAWWKKTDQVKIGELLQIAYDKATSFTLQDLTLVYTNITGQDGIIKAYNPPH